MVEGWFGRSGYRRKLPSWEGGRSAKRFYIARVELELPSSTTSWRTVIEVNNGAPGVRTKGVLHERTSGALRRLPLGHGQQTPRKPTKI